MEKERRIKVLSMVALIVAVLGLTVAFASLSQTLTINGTASVNAASWDVHIENLRQTWVDGTAEVINEPVISSDGKGIENLQVSLTKPGDGVKYSFDFVNSGTIDAINNDVVTNGFSSVNVNIPEEGSAEYTELLNTYYTALFPKADWDGDGTTTNEERVKAAENITYYFESYIGNSLNAGSKLNEYVEIVWSNSSTELPKGEVVMNIDLSFVFNQK